MDKQKQLQQWQHWLGLDDWSIKLEDECAPYNMSMENVAGCTVWQESIKAATIEILDPKYYGERMVPFNWEKTLVHELLHLKTCLVSSNVDDLQERYMHQMIDDLARAFVAVKGVGHGSHTKG